MLRNGFTPVPIIVLSIWLCSSAIAASPIIPRGMKLKAVGPAVEELQQVHFCDAKLPGRYFKLCKATRPEAYHISNLYMVFHDDDSDAPKVEIMVEFSNSTTGASSQVRSETVLFSNAISRIQSEHNSFTVWVPYLIPSSLLLALFYQVQKIRGTVTEASTLEIQMLDEGDKPVRFSKVEIDDLPQQSPPGTLEGSLYVHLSRTGIPGEVELAKQHLSIVPVPRLFVTRSKSDGDEYRIQGFTDGELTFYAANQISGELVEVFCHYRLKRNTASPSQTNMPNQFAEIRDCERDDDDDAKPFDLDQAIIMTKYTKEEGYKWKQYVGTGSPEILVP